MQLPVDIESSANGTGNDSQRIIANEKDILDEVGRPYYLTEIAKERILRSGKEIGDNTRLDTGFKVFKLDSSNLKKWNPKLENLEITLQESMHNFIVGRSELDVVYEILLKEGLDIATKVEVEDFFDGEKIYIIGCGALMICLCKNITFDKADEIVRLHKKYDSELWRVVFCDNGFASDMDKTNIKEILKTAGLEEDAFICI